MNRLEHTRVAAARIDIATCRQPDTATNRSANIGENVTEKIVGDNYIESLGVGQEEHGSCVNM